MVQDKKKHSRIGKLERQEDLEFQVKHKSASRSKTHQKTPNPIGCSWPVTCLQ